MNLMTLITTALTAPVAAVALATPSTPSTPAPPAGPPVLHVSDVTGQGSARHERLDQAYTDCLIAAGAPTIPADAEPRAVPAASFSEATGLVLDSPVPAGPRAACADLEPQYPPILQASSNPDFAAMAQTYVSCLEDGGLHVRLLGSENLDWTYRAGFDVPDDSYALEDDCLIGTFGSD